MITLFSNPPDAPLSFKIVNDDGRDLLIQTDYDWPGIASTFGFSLEMSSSRDSQFPAIIQTLMGRWIAKRAE